MITLSVSGRLTMAENFSLQRDVGSSEYACVLFNILAKLMQERIVLRELNREAVRNPISL